jgi:hypothetical protein
MTTDMGSASSQSVKKFAKKRRTKPPTPPSGKDNRKKRNESPKEEPAKKDKAGDGEPLGIAMQTARMMLEMQKDSIAEIIRAQWEELKKDNKPTYSPLAWRGSGYKKAYLEERTKGDTPATLSRDSSAPRGETLSDESEDDMKGEGEPTVKRLKRLDKERRRGRRRAMRALKVEKPTPWDGAPVYNKFDKWVDQVDEWQRQHELTDYAVIATMGFLLTDDAKDWFKSNVRDREQEWTLQELNSALFDEMFPADMDVTLHEMWRAAEQGSHSLRKWHKYLTKLYERVPNLSIHEFRRKFMEGANGWLREKWAEEGFKPEDPSLEISLLLEIGQRFE